MIVARRQILVQLSDDLVTVLDRQARRRSVSRSQVIREAIEKHTHDELEAEIDRQIVDAYTRIPQEDDPAADWAAIEVARALDEEERKAGYEPW